MKSLVKRAWMAWLFLPVLFLSCATYNAQLQEYYTNIQSNEYSKAMHTLEKNKLIQKDRNRLLYYFEKGKLYHMMREYDSSNRYLNLADDFSENARKSVGDVVKANLINPMMQTYTGEDFERFIMHYYKALNYLALGNTEDAVVEARRITLTSNAQSDKFNGKANRYSKDAFAYNLQGMIYEAAGDANNAFISYRNAADIYLEAKNNYYGVAMPAQLQRDVLRTANQMGFNAEAEKYKTLFSAVTMPPDTTSGGALILFVEEGFAPVKQQQDFSILGSSNGYGYTDNFGRYQSVPFDYSYYNISNSDALSLLTFHVAIPYYQVRFKVNNTCTAQAAGNTYTAATAEDLNNIAVGILNERMLREIANALARQIVKKLAEKGVQTAVKEMAKKDDDSNKKTDTEKKKDEDKAETAGQVAGLVVGLLNAATEKADTRNWQSLPAFINYVRIPLQAGENTIVLQSGNKTETLKIIGNGSLQIKNWIAN